MHPVSSAQLTALLDSERIEKGNLIINLFEHGATKGGAFRAEDQATFYFSAKIDADALKKILEAIKPNE